jgi:hypothetical protein
VRYLDSDQSFVNTHGNRVLPLGTIILPEGQDPGNMRRAINLIAPLVPTSHFSPRDFPLPRVPDLRPQFLLPLHSLLTLEPGLSLEESQDQEYIVESVPFLSVRFLPRYTGYSDIYLP